MNEQEEPMVHDSDGVWRVMEIEDPDDDDPTDRNSSGYTFPHHGRWTPE